MVVDLPVLCTACGHPYWLTEAVVRGVLVWELEEDGDLAATGYGDLACPLCGGPLVEDPLRAEGGED